MAKKVYKSKTVSIEWSYDFSRTIRENFSSRQLVSKVKKLAIDALIVPTIKKGISPVSGKRGFAPYKGVAGAKKEIKTNKIDMTNMSNSEKKRARKENKHIKSQAQKNIYPYSVMDEYPNKKIRPVNLTLSGEMLSYYSCAETENPMVIEVGFLDSAPEEVIAKAITNNNGLNGVPERRMVPLPGEKFTAKITLVIKGIFAQILGQAIKRRNNK